MFRPIDIIDQQRMTNYNGKERQIRGYRYGLPYSVGPSGFGYSSTDPGAGGPPPTFPVTRSFGQRVLACNDLNFQPFFFLSLRET